MKKKTAICMCVFLTLWGAGILWSYQKLSSFVRAPGEPANASLHWDQHSGLQFDPSKNNLFVFIHPKCSCSKATLWDLETLLSKVENKVAVTVIFDWPTGKSEAWYKGSIWKLANSLKNVRIFVDHDSRERTRFQVKTSGQALYYSKAGELIFSGGLTPMRGHVGDSIGQEMILGHVQSNSILTRSTAVFGCSLQDDVKLASEVSWKM